MYLSKVSLLNSLQAKSALVDLGKNGAYATHQLLWRLFTEDTQRDFLFKQEQSTSQIRFLIDCTLDPLNSLDKEHHLTTCPLKGSQFFFFYRNSIFMNQSIDNRQNFFLT